jgi:very-short-patch-repair endonuclease
MDNTEGTSEPEDSVETTRGASPSKEQLQRDYVAAGGLRKLGAMYGVNYGVVRAWLVAADIEIQKRGCNGSNHTEAWHESQQRYREEHADEAKAQRDQARRNRWDDPAQHDRMSDAIRASWQQREKWLRPVDDGADGTDYIPPAEAALHDALKRASLSFIANAVVLGGHYYVDILFCQQMLAVEIDAYPERVMSAYNIRRSACIRESGIEITRFAADDVMIHPDECVKSLKLYAEDEPIYVIRSPQQTYGILPSVRAGKRHGDDDIVRSALMEKMQNPAEMTGSPENENEA